MILRDGSGDSSGAVPEPFRKCSGDSSNVNVYLTAYRVIRRLFRVTPIRKTNEPTRKRYAFWIDIDHLDALDAIKIRDGVLPSEQIRRALEDWIVKKGLKVRRESVVTQSERKRADTRRRS